MKSYVNEVMYFQKVICKKLGILSATDEKNRIQIRKSVVRIRGSGSVLKCHGSTPLVVDVWMPTGSDYQLMSIQNLHPNRQALDADQETQKGQKISVSPENHFSNPL
jgi:hypothetical protein